EGPEEVELERELRRRRRLHDLHAPLADVLVPFPLVHGSLAAGRAAQRAPHRGVLLLVRRPGGPPLKVVDLREDLLRRRLDGGRALDPEAVRPAGDIGKQPAHEHDRRDTDEPQHVRPPGASGEQARRIHRHRAWDCSYRAPPLMAGNMVISAPSARGVARPPVHRQLSAPTKRLTWGRTSPPSVSTRSRTPGAAFPSAVSASPSETGPPP